MMYTHTQASPHARTHARTHPLTHARTRNLHGPVAVELEHREDIRVQQLEQIVPEKWGRLHLGETSQRCRSRPKRGPAASPPS